MIPTAVLKAGVTWTVAMSWRRIRGIGGSEKRRHSNAQSTGGDLEFHRPIARSIGGDERIETCFLLYPVGGAYE